jgi:hypothetical protein
MSGNMIGYKTVCFFIFSILIFLSLIPIPIYAQSNDIAYIGIAYDGADQYSKFKHYVKVQGKDPNTKQVVCEISFDITPVYLNEQFESKPILRFLSVGIIYSTNASLEIISYTFSNQVLNAIKTNCSPDFVSIRVGSYEIIGGKIVFTDPSNLVYNVSQVPPAPSGFDVGSFFASIGKFFEFIGASIQGFFAFIGVAGDMIRYTFVEGFKLLGSVIGKPGDPESPFYASLYRLSLMTYAGNKIIGSDVQAVLNCQKPLATVSGLLKNYRDKDLSKTICDIENDAPQGVVGFLASAFYVVSKSTDIIVFIARHFLIIHAVIFTGILAFGASQMIQKRSIEPMLDSLRLIYSIFKFYFSIGKFIYEAGLKFIQAIASLIEAILPF